MENSFVIFVSQEGQQNFSVKEYVDNLRDTVVLKTNVRETRQYSRSRITIDATAMKLASKRSPTAVRTMRPTVVFRNHPKFNPRLSGNVWNSVGRRLGHV